MNKEIIWLCAAQLVDYFAKNHKIHNLYINVAEFSHCFFIYFILIDGEKYSSYTISLYRGDKIVIERWKAELSLFIGT